MSAAQDRKRIAALAAAAEVGEGMVVGLGTGSTASLAIAALAERMQSGLRILGVPTSEASAAQARGLGIPLTTLEAHPAIDLTIDGADEVQADTLDLIKGLGGALLREKLVACASRRLVIVADDAKLVETLGSRVTLPVEIVAFGWDTTLARLAALGVHPVLRLAASGHAFVTDGGNLIADCAVGPLADPARWQERLKAVTGVIETGLFLGLATQAIIGTAQGPSVLRRAGSAGEV